MRFVQKTPIADPTLSADVCLVERNGGEINLALRFNERIVAIIYPWGGISWVDNTLKETFPEFARELKDAKGVCRITDVPSDCKKVVSC